MQHFHSAEDLVRALAPEDPVYGFRPQVLRQRTEAFLSAFPGEVLYAVKCNPLPQVLQEMRAAGVRHYDTASLKEIALIDELCPEGTAYFMHPVKGRAAIRETFQRYGTRHFVLDHRDELEKTRAVLGGDIADTALMVRMATAGTGAAFNLSDKFGAPPEETAALLQESARHARQVGLCFHVGSQCLEPADFGLAFDQAGQVIARAGVALAFLDIGGGFPAQYLGDDIPRLEAFMAEIRQGLAALNLPADCRVLCEPGRALVADCMSLLVQVQLRKDRRIYINDGIYGGLKGADIGIRHPVRLVRPGGASEAPFTHFEVLGPTCDSLDVLDHRLVLPADVGEGDWLEFGQLGAYSAALRTDFNGFQTHRFMTLETPFDVAAARRPESVTAAE